MDTRLIDLSFELKNPYNDRKDVTICIEYYQMEAHEMKVFFHIIAGVENEQDYRFSTKLVFILLDFYFDGTHQQIKDKIIEVLMPSVMEMITLLDELVSVEKKH